jgi:hypothetical protein
MESPLQCRGPDIDAHSSVLLLLCVLSEQQQIIVKA